MRLFRLLRYGDPEGVKETKEIIAEANRTSRRLRDHVDKNNLSEALGLVFAPNPPGWRQEKKRQA